jgi:hypothetical protein
MSHHSGQQPVPAIPHWREVFIDDLFKQLAREEAAAHVGVLRVEAAKGVLNQSLLAELSKRELTLCESAAAVESAKVDLEWRQRRAEHLRRAIAELEAYEGATPFGAA